MKQDNHEHNMVLVDRSAVKSARRLCIIVLAIATPIALFYLQAPPATKALIDHYSTWPCIIIGAIVAIVALRAVFSR